MLIDPPVAVGVFTDPETEVFPGVGTVEMCRDGRVVARDPEGKRKLGYYSRRAEAARGNDPRCVLTLHIDGPFQCLTYGFGTEGWYLIERKDGFA